jgi:hypothetical protein
MLKWRDEMMIITRLYRHTITSFFNDIRGNQVYHSCPTHNFILLYMWHLLNPDRIFKWANQIKNGGKKKNKNPGDNKSTARVCIFYYAGKSFPGNICTAAPPACVSPARISGLIYYYSTTLCFSLVERVATVVVVVVGVGGGSMRTYITRRPALGYEFV